MKTYVGILTKGDLRILVHDTEKEVPFDLEHIKRHSPTGMNIGYGGAGPADTALSILADCIGLEKIEAIYHYFKNDFVANWKPVSGVCFQIKSDEIQNWIDSDFIGFDNGQTERRHCG